MRNFIAGFLIAAALLMGVYFVFQKTQSAKVQEVKQVQKYYCPMHPTYISDKPGNCTICGMKLVLLDSEKQLRRKSDDSSSNQQQQESTTSPEGYAPVKISADKLQLMGVTTTEAKWMDLDQSIRTVGRVVPDETRIHHIHTKFEGYIETIYANYVGQFVKKGDPLFSVYSPELLATQREYLIALKAKTESSGKNGTVFGVDLLEAARQRLALWDIGPQQIDELERTQEPVKALMVRSPVTGYVTQKTAVQGTKVLPSDTLYDIVDLSLVWIMADIYEINANMVKVGTPVTIELPYQTNKIITGKFAYIDPLLDPQTRTIKARIEVPNPSNALKPDMYANVILQGTAGKGLMIPDSAVISTGERNIVFVAARDGEFHPREVAIGTKIRGYYEIKSGLSEGEKVVTSGNFLMDSESKLKAAVSRAGGAHQH
ncbi:efflux RND transporter periplasmic adaptor subunit [bacterium]|nr:efflux RND transporter periplasmic adaptor subunit [bacterium]